MQRLYELNGNMLRWVPLRPSLNDYELRARDALFATLSWAAAGGKAYAETHDDCWVLHHEQKQVQIAHADQSLAATFRFGWDGGVLYLAGGATFHWGYNAALGRSEWVENGLLLRAQLALQPTGALGQVELAPGATDLLATPLLLVLDRYLMDGLVRDYLAGQQRAVPAIARPPRTKRPPVAWPPSAGRQA